MKILIFILLLPFIKSESTTSFSCLNVDPVSNFDGEKFAGVWYEIEMFLPAPSPKLCTNLSLIWTKSLSGYKGIQSKYSDLTKSHYNLSFSWLPQNDTSVAHFRVNFEQPQGIYELAVKVLDTDYDKFAVLQNCYALHGINYRTITILGRDRAISSTALQKAHDALVRFNIDQSNPLIINQKNCN